MSFRFSTVSGWLVAFPSFCALNRFRHFRGVSQVVAVSGRHSADISIPAVFVTNAAGKQLLALIDQPGSACTMTRTFDSTAWSVMAVSFISLLAVSAVLATFFFVRRHRLRRIGSRLLLISVQDDGMTPRQVKALPSSVFKMGGEGNGTTETCAICLDDYEAGEKLRILPCKHGECLKISSKKSAVYKQKHYLF